MTTRNINSALVGYNADPPGSGNEFATKADVTAVTLTLAASTLAGRGSAGGAGLPVQITLGTNLSMAGTTLNASGGGGGGETFVQFMLMGG